ncbi:hypothetical protein A45J_1474 [hot springs metagenome]
MRISKSTVEISQYLKELLSDNLDARLFPKGNKELDSIVMDITSLMEKIRDRLNFAETEKERMEAILRGMSDGVLITDDRGMVILANQSFKNLISVNEDIEGKQIIEVIRNAHLIGIFRDALKSGQNVSKEINISRPHKGSSGSHKAFWGADKDIHLIATAVPVYSNTEYITQDEKKWCSSDISQDSDVDHTTHDMRRNCKSAIVSGVVFTLHDITRLKQLEEMRKDFVANVSHEIKTPITAIKGFAETLLDGAMDDKENAVRFLGMIKSHSERLNNLVDDLLTLSKIELGDAHINKIDVNFEQVIDTVFMTLKEKADKKGLYLKKAIPDTTQTIFADKDRLMQIMLNLVDNGIKFTEKGGVTVGIDETGGRITIYVHDTGIGISSNHLHRLGERFYRVDRARSRDMGGTGLGLAIVKHLVNAHDWNMRIESELGRGTRVNIIIDRYL